MNIKLDIDHREHGLIELLKNSLLKDVFETKLLVHGDILISSNDKLLCLFERKTITDLRASIMDGRYKNQKKEMMEIYSNCSIYYIIEGFVNFSEQQEQEQGAIINTMIRDHISVFFTANISDTLSLITGIYKRIIDNPDIYNGNSSHSQDVIVKKEKCITRQDFLRNTLCQIPGISFKTATEITKHFKDFNDFHQQLDKKPLADQMILLNKVKLSGRSISKTALQNIINYIF